MKRLSFSTVIFIIWIALELITLLALLIAKVPYKTCSNVFLGFTAFCLFLILCQWIGFKSLNSQIRRNVIKLNSTDKMSIRLFNKQATVDKDGNFSKEDIIKARRNRGIHFILMCMLPLLVSLILTLLFSFL